MKKVTRSRSDTQKWKSSRNFFCMSRQQNARLFGFLIAENFFINTQPKKTRHRWHFLLQLVIKTELIILWIFCVFFWFSCRIDFFRGSQKLVNKFKLALTWHTHPHTWPQSGNGSRDANKVLCCCTINFDSGDVIEWSWSVNNWKIMKLEEFWSGGVCWEVM